MVCRPQHNQSRIDLHFRLYLQEFESPIALAGSASCPRRLPCLTPELVPGPLSSRRVASLHLARNTGWSQLAAASRDCTPRTVTSLTKISANSRSSFQSVHSWSRLVSNRLPSTSPRSQRATALWRV